MHINDGYLLLMYDFHIENSGDDTAQRKFRSEIIKMGYRRLQYSIYCKYIRELKASDFEIAAVRCIAPKMDDVLIMRITTKQADNSVFTLRGNVFLTDNVRKTYVEY